MDEQPRQAKFTGHSPDISTGSASESAQPQSTVKSGASPVSKTAHSKGASKNSTGGASGSNLLAAQILAVQQVMGDYRGLKEAAPKSWQTSSDGKIYWCASVPGRRLEIVDGILLVDGKVASRLLEEILAVE